MHKFDRVEILAAGFPSPEFLSTNEVSPMGRTVMLFLSLVALVFSALLLMNACGGSSKTTFSSLKLQHIVVIFQENRTPDNLFHDPVLMNAGADIASSGLNSSGQTIQLTPAPLGVAFDLSHSHASFLSMYDGGKMDGAD